jgi:hypothetical protein
MIKKNGLMELWGDEMMGKKRWVMEEWNIGKRNSLF